MIPPREPLITETLFAYHRVKIEKWFPLIKAGGRKAE
jgi:hypothetical protein